MRTAINWTPIQEFCMTFAYRRCPLARVCYEKYEEPERYAVRAVASGM